MFRLRYASLRMTVNCCESLEFSQKDSFQCLRRQSSQILKTVNPGVVSIVPAWLQGVTANDDETVQLKTRVGITDLRSQDVAEYIGFAAAGRTRAGATEKFQIKI